MASPNMARYKIIERATKKKIQKMREVQGKPYTDSKNTYILVNAIPIKDFKRKTITPHLAEVVKYRPHKKNTYFPSVIRCPICKRKISWSNIWEAYICYKSAKHDPVVYEMVQEDIRNARGRIFIYNEQVKTAGPIKEETKRYGYLCRLPYKKSHPQGKICGRRFKKYEDLQKHLRDKHNIKKPKKMGVYTGEERTSDQKVTARVFDYIITSKMTAKPSIIYCPICNEAAPANVEEKYFECVNGHKWYSEAITKPRKYYCPHCTRNIEQRNDQLRCEEKYRCPGIRLLAREFGSRKRKQEEASNLTKHLGKILEWNQIYLLYPDPDREKSEKEKRAEKTFRYYKKEGKALVLVIPKAETKETPIKEELHEMTQHHKRRCPKCKKVTPHEVFDRQMRAADEAPSIFYRCKKCGHTVRED